MMLSRLQVGVIALAILASALLVPAHAQRRRADTLPGYDRTARATLVHPAIVYVSPDDDAAHVSEVLPGHEVVIMEKNGDWLRVFANTDTPDQQSDADVPEFGNNGAPPPESGWIKNKGVVTTSTPNGAMILFGAAANFEDEAAHPHPPKDAAEEAHLLYHRSAVYFPDSPLAAQAAFRSADVRWQLDRADISTLPSAHEADNYLRPQIYEGEMQKVIKMYPNTKYAELAAYDELDNKTCGDWQGLPKCPEMEAELYRKYAERYPDSPKAPEALYNAVYREGVLVDMYQVQDDRRRSEQAAANTQALAAELKQKYPDSDFAARGASIAYRVQQHIPVYGNDRD